MANPRTVDDESFVTAADEIRELFAYDRWANARILAAAAGLTPGQFDRDLGSSFPSVHDTLAHILAAEWVWLMRWRGTSPARTPENWDLSTCDALRDRWREVERDLEAFLATLDDDALRRTVHYRTTAGQADSAPLGPLLRHVVNHSAYHRGQIVTMLRQLGAEAPATDLVLFHRERAATAS